MLKIFWHLCSAWSSFSVNRPVWVGCFFGRSIKYPYLLGYVKIEVPKVAESTRKLALVLKKIIGVENHLANPLISLPKIRNIIISYFLPNFSLRIPKALVI